jgi:HemK-related putative methylase
MTLKQTLWRQWLKARFHLLQQHRYDQLVLESVAGRPFLILPQVFNPTLFLTSEFMVASLDQRLIPAGSTLLDMGTGSGIGGVFSAQWASRVTAIDLNPAAVRCARINSILNHVDDRMSVYQGDLFEAIPQAKFDVMLFNPPYFQGEPRNELDRAFRASNVMSRFAREAGLHLNALGTILLLLSSLSDEKSLLELFNKQGFLPDTVAQQRLVAETITIYRLRMERHG